MIKILMTHTNTHVILCHVGIYGGNYANIKVGKDWFSCYYIYVGKDVGNYANYKLAGIKVGKDDFPLIITEELSKILRE